ncbi:glycoside hydrolase family 16 protein [Nocardioides marmoraquaticus]
MSSVRLSLRAALLATLTLLVATTMWLPTGSATAAVSSRVGAARVVASLVPVADQVYVARVEVRAIRRSTTARVTLQHVVGGAVVGSKTLSVRARRAAWRSGSVSLRTLDGGGVLRVLARSTGGSRKPVRVSSVLRPLAQPVVTAPRPTTPAPTTPAPTTPAPTTPAPTTPEVAPETAPAGWRVDMVEDFDSLAPKRWSIADGWGAANESSWLRAANVSTVDGILRVQGRHESAGGRDYTSGRLDTNGKYALPNYFRAEVRAKVPYQRGLWSAPLWFRPTNGQMGEIDLVETYGSETRWPTVHQTIHSAYGADHKFVSTKTLFSRIGPQAPTAWHTYTIEKKPGSIKMWVDGVPTATFTPASASWFHEYYESGKQWNLRVNMQIGGSYGLPDATTDWSGDNSVMQLDYIKTWVPAS